MTISDVTFSPERWAEIPGTHGHYEASDQGRVRRAVRGEGTVLGRIVAGSVSSEGYRSFKPCVNGKHLSRLSFHRAVWSAFNGPIPERHDICHWNHKRDDNRLENLYAGTRSENLRQSVNEGRPVGQGMKGVPSPSRKLSNADYSEIRRLYGLRLRKQVDLAKDYGVDKNTISRITRQQMPTEIAS